MSTIALHQTFQSPVVLRRAIEACWLAAVVAVPLALVPKDWMFFPAETPKVFVLHSLALTLIALVALEGALTSNRRASTGGPTEGWLRQLGLVGHPASAVFIAAAAVLISNAVSVALSPVWAVSIEGVDIGRDSYGLFSMASYVTIFWVTATHVKSAGQLQRLVWAIVAAGVAMSIIGVGQHFGLDLLLQDIPRQRRVTLTAGNPDFAGSLLVITIPLTLAATLAIRERIAMIPHIAGSIAILSLEITAMVLTQTRSSWVGLGIGLSVLVIAVGWVHGLSSLRRLALLGTSLSGLILLLGVISPSTSTEVLGRLSSIPSSVINFGGSDLSHRALIWSSGVRAYRSGDWVNVADHPDIPATAPKPLLRLVGFGPNMYEYANFATAGPVLTAHAHNFLVHTLVELGSLGVGAYLGLFFAIGVVLLRMLLRARAGGETLFYSYTVIGLAAVMAGRMVEQVAGKAQIADLTLSWVLAAVVVAMANMNSQPALASSNAPASRAPRQSVMVRGRLPLQHTRLAGAVLLTIMLLIFWWQSIFLPLASHVASAGAFQSAKLGLIDESIEGFEQSISRAPGLALNHTALAELYRTLSSTEPTLAGRMALLRQADRHLEIVLQRNPIDHRARSFQADTMIEMVALDSEMFTKALTAIRTLRALQPGYWKPLLHLSKLYLTMGDIDTARAARNAAEQVRDYRHFNEAVLQLDLELSAHD